VRESDEARIDAAVATPLGRRFRTCRHRRFGTDRVADTASVRRRIRIRTPSGHPAQRAPIADGPFYVTLRGARALRMTYAADGTPSG